MLTQEDLSAIGKLIDKKFKIGLDSIHRSLEKINTDFQVLKKNLRKVESDISIITAFFDNQYLDHEKRLKRVENHLHLPHLSS